MPQRKREAGVNGSGEKPYGFPGRKIQCPFNLLDCLLVPALVPMAAQRSVSDEKDGFQLPTETNKIPSGSAMAESTRHSFSVSPEDTGPVCHSPLL